MSTTGRGHAGPLFELHPAEEGLQLLQRRPGAASWDRPKGGRETVGRAQDRLCVIISGPRERASARDSDARVIPAAGDDVLDAEYGPPIDQAGRLPSRPER